MAEPTATTTAISWFPVLTLLIGWAGGYLTDMLRDGRALIREREAREAARRDQLSEQHRKFQHETLLELQEQLFALGRAVGERHTENMRYYTQHGEWNGRASAEVNEKTRLAHAQTSKLSVRIYDDKVRELVKALKRNATETSGADSREESEVFLFKMLGINEELQERIGQLLRSMHDEEVRVLHE